MNLKKLALGIAMSAVSLAAVAAVNLNEDGTGWVGKGDVQTPWAWNNATMQKNHTFVTFEVQETTSWEVTCTWTTGEGTRGEKSHSVTRTRVAFLNSSIASDSRKTGQWTGWNLKGWSGSGTEDTAAPQLNSPCNSQGVPADGMISAIQETSDGTGPTLWSVFNGDRRQLVITPPL